MNKQEIVSENLEKLAEIQSIITGYEAKKNDIREKLNSEKQKLIDSILTPEILAKIDEIKAEFQPKYDALESDADFVSYKTAADSLTAEIKDGVRELGETVKSTKLMAVYSKGRASWDDKGLLGYAAAHPEIQSFRTVGESSVSIRKV